MKKSILRFTIALIVSFALLFGIFILQSGFRDSKTALIPILCDATFSVGIIFLCVGLLFFISNLGLFDILAYGMASFFNLFRKRTKNSKFVDFLEYKETKRANSIAWGHLAVVGIIYIVIASVLLMFC